MGFKKTWGDPVWSKVIATGICALIALAVTALDWWVAIGAGGRATYSFMMARTALPNWCIGLLGAWTALTVLLLGARVAVSAKMPSPDWQTDYIIDEFFGLRWRWSNAGGKSSNFYSFCPNCDYQVHPRNDSGYLAVDRIFYACESCGARLGTFDETQYSLESRVLRTVHQKIRNGTWQPKIGPARVV